MAAVALMAGPATPPPPEQPAATCRVPKVDRQGTEEIRCRPLKPERPSAAQRQLPGLF
jgi:hypothetical protein